MSDDGFSSAIDDRYFEDYQAGSMHEFGPISVTEEEIIEFSKRYDPQPFHTDPQAAKQSVFGGLIASGWHTAGLMMRLFVEHYLSRVASLASPGIDQLRWNAPVRPGDELRVRITVEQTKHSRSKPDRGVVISFIEVLNQDHQVVMTMKAINFLKRRNGDSKQVPAGSG